MELSVTDAGIAWENLAVLWHVACDYLHLWEKHHYHLLKIALLEHAETIVSTMKGKRGKPSNKGKEEHS